MVIEARLTRFYSSELGTPGVLRIGDFRCHTLELPWKDNARKVSCIPAGTYECDAHTSPRFGPCFAVCNVPGRSAILIHPGNHAGAAPAYASDVEGCILVGDSFGMVGRQWGIRNSRETLRRLEAYLWPRPWRLVVEFV